MHRSLALAMLLCGYACCFAQIDTTIITPRGTVVHLTIPEAQQGFAIGARPPLLAGRDLDDRPSTASSKRVIYFFSFVGCKPCAEAMAHFERDDWRLRDDLRFVYVNQQDTPEIIRAYVASKYTAGAFDVLRLDAASKARTQVQSFPLTVVVDAGKRVEAIYSGYAAAWVEALLRPSE